jgi:uncharacterized UBP type Zn finger protein
VYGNGACYLKNQITEAVSNEGIWSAERQNILTNTALSCDNNKRNGATFLASGGQFKIICGNEYNGGTGLGLHSNIYNETTQVIMINVPVNSYRLVELYSLI